MEAKKAKAAKGRSKLGLVDLDRADFDKDGLIVIKPERRSLLSTIYREMGREIIMLVVGVALGITFGAILCNFW